jgi:hypothetical protein
MKDFLESFSLGSGALLIAIFSVGIVWLLIFLLPKALDWLWVVLVPFSLAYCLYWSPVWLGADDIAQYGAWSFLGVGTWFVAGLFPSAILALILRKRRGRVPNGN